MPYMHYQVLSAMLSLERKDLEKYKQEHNEIEVGLSKNKIVSLEYAVNLIRKIWDGEVKIVEKEYATHNNR